MTQGTTDPQETGPTPDRFESLAQEIIENSRKDRKSFLETIGKMEELIESAPEVALLMCEQTIRAYDVLNKMNSNMVGLASVVLKRQRPSDSPADDVYGDIGDLANPGVQ